MRISVWGEFSCLMDYKRVNFSKYAVGATDIRVTLMACIILALAATKGSAQLVAKAGPDQAVSPTSPAVTIGGSPAATGGVPPYSYSWSTSTGLSAANIANPEASPVVTTTYRLTVTDSKVPTPNQATDTMTAKWQPFVHPGILLTRLDLERIKTMVTSNTAPWSQGYALFAADKYSQATYPLYGPFTSYGRAPNVNLPTTLDARGAYHNAIMWYLTGNPAHAAKAKQILNGYAGTLTRIEAGQGAQLAAAFAYVFFVNAAEIIRYTDSTWARSSIVQFEQWLKNVWYPVLHPFAEFASGNWDASMTKAMIGIGVFCNDRDIFERAVRYYVDGPGNGRLTHLIINEDGQGQESGRAQSYAQLGIGCLAESAQIAWSQGVDLWGHHSNRLLKGFEYTARYNLGETDPAITPPAYVDYVDRTAILDYSHWPNFSTKRQDRGEWKPTYEIAYNHYVKRMGLAAPYKIQVATLNRPEGCYTLYQDTDWVGCGTLLFTLPSGPPPAATAPPQFPSGVYARDTSISWARSQNATSYTLKRGSVSGGPYDTTVATGITGNTYTDTAATAGSLNYYVVIAKNAFGDSPPSVERSATRGGVPSGWTDADIGTPPLPGHADYSDAGERKFEIEAGGTGIGILGFLSLSSTDNFHFTHRTMTGDGTVMARAGRPLTSRLSAFGVMMRETTANNAKHASMMITPSSNPQAWSATWRRRSSAGGATSSTDFNIPEPYREYDNRFGIPYWVRVTRSGGTPGSGGITFTGYYSPDGVTWTQLGSRSITMGNSIQVGLAACSGWSGSPALTTSVVLDNVSVTGWVPPPASPVITLEGAPMVAGDTVYGTAPSPPASFTVAGSGLTGAPGNLTVTPPAGYEVSLSSGSGYSTSLPVPYSSATLANTTVYLRLAAATPVGTYAGNITVSGGGAASKIIAPSPSRVNYGFVSFDDFNDNSLSSFWRTNTSIPQGGAFVFERNGRIEITGRGHLITAQQFDPVPCGLKITGQWTFASSQDFLQILVRSDGQPSGSFGETANGIEFFLNQNDAVKNLQIRSKSSGTITVTQDTTGALSSAASGEAFDFVIEDKGDGQLSFTMTQVGNPGNTATSTGTVTSDNFSKNFVVFHNREGNSNRSYLDNVTCTQSSTNIVYASWAVSMGLSGGVNDGMSLDPDRDGFSNIEEFALGGHPLNGMVKAMGYAFHADGADSGRGSDQNDFILSCALRSAGLVENGTATLINPAAGVIYTVEGGTVPGSCDAMVLPTTPPITAGLPAADSLPAGFQYRSFYLGGSNGLPGRGFMRVKVAPIVLNCGP